MSEHVNIEARLLGAHVARLTVTRFNDAARTDQLIDVELTLDSLYRLRQHVDVAIESLEDRRLRDSIAGHCELCSDTRMVHEQRHGHDWAEHCPVCTPKLVAAMALLDSWGVT